MEQSLPTEDEIQNDAETGRGHYQTVVPTDAERTSLGSDWVHNMLMELRSFLDDNGHPKEKNEENLTEVTFPKVPLVLQKNPGSKYYFDPMVISFGLYHHGKRGLQEFDTIKTEAMLKFIKESGKSFSEFYNKVRDMNHLTRACYIDCSEEKYCDGTLALIMLRDGCLISYLLDLVDHNKWTDVSKLFVNYGSFLGFDYVTKDMVLLENQIPLAVLELLMSLRYDKNHKPVPTMIKEFIYNVFLGIDLREAPDKRLEARYLLACIQKEFSKPVNRRKERTRLTNNSKRGHDRAEECPSYRSLCELKAKGIHFKPINYKNKSFSFKDVEFIPCFLYAQLKLPPLYLNYSTVIMWNNLIAFELSPACKAEFVISSYINFLTALIANPDDVKELRSKRILLNDADSDEEVFKLFKGIVPGFQDRRLYRDVRDDIEKHCSSKTRTWAAEIIYKYFRNPWSALGLFAAITVLALSFVQTYFTIYPVND